MDRNNWSTKQGDGNLVAAAAVPRFDPDAFIGDVVNAVNDLTMDGFNSLEEFVAQTLDLKTDEERRPLKTGLDRAYHKVQDNMDESLARWEAGCRDRVAGLAPDEPEYVARADNGGGGGGGGGERPPEEADEQAVDAELRSLRAQLVAAHREGAKMRRELASLEKQLALRREVLTDVEAADVNLDDAVVEEIMKSASLLKETMAKATRIQSGRPTMARDISGGTSLEPCLDEEIAAVSLPPDVRIEDAALVKLLG